MARDDGDQSFSGAGATRTRGAARTWEVAERPWGVSRQESSKEQCAGAGGSRTTSTERSVRAALQGGASLALLGIAGIGDEVLGIVEEARGITAIGYVAR
jgi:hypothetical protein